MGLSDELDGRIPFHMCREIMLIDNAPPPPVPIPPFSLTKLVKKMAGGSRVDFYSVGDWRLLLAYRADVTRQTPLRLPEDAVPLGFLHQC